jgi:hypothetical protein
MNIARLFFLLIAVLLLISGCSSTVIKGSWKNPEFKGQVKKVYIIGISKQDTTRRIFEDDFRLQLAKYGVIGISSYQDLPTTENLSKEEIASKASSNGADAILMARAVGKRTEEVVTPGTYRTTLPRYGYGAGYYPNPYYRNYGSYYARSWDTVYQPATVTQYQIVTIEANLYEASSAELIWSAQLDTTVGGNLQSLIDGFIAKVTKDMKEKGVI